MKNRKFILKIFLLIIAIGIVISSYNVCSILFEYKNSDSVYDGISSFATIEDTDKDIGENSKDGIPNKAVDFEKLREINPDIKGWLYNEGLNIDYPVVQGYDNNQYLKRLPTGEYSENGTLFFDSGNKKTDKHFLVYGHNMLDGSMFGNLQKYSEQEFYNKYPAFYFYEANDTYKLNVISAHYTSNDDFTYSLGDRLDMKPYVEYIREKSCIKTNAEYETGDCIITLSTCAYLRNSNRFVVHCLVEKI